MAEESSIFDDLQDPGGVSGFDDVGVPFDWSKLLDANTITKLLSGGLGAYSGIQALTGGGGSSQKPTGYQGKVPVYQAIRQQVPMAETDPARRPGSGGRQYFTNVQYQPRDNAEGIAGAYAGAQQQADLIAQANNAATPGQRTALLNAAQSAYPMYAPLTAPPSVAAAPPAATTPPAGNTNDQNSSDQQTNVVSESAQGGLIGLARGGSTEQPRFLAGGTDGMADKIPATIEGKQPAKLSHGEFVISADCVSALGSGNSEAGAKVLYDMMDRIRKHAHGSKKQVKPVNPKKVLPA